MSDPKVENPFGETAVATRPGNALVDTATAREQSEVQGMIVLAKKFPRDQKAALDRILNACTRASLAECAVYQYARGGSDVTGPSIRLAEAIAQNWGNLQFGIRELEQRNGESTVEAFAWDLETNVRQSKVFQVSHVRHTKQGSKLLTDPRDIYEMVANQGARRMRSCILSVIPGDVVDAAVDQCDLTLKSAAGEVTPERIKAMLEKFAVFGVTREQIEARIQRRIDTVSAAQLVSLGKVYNSLRDGMSQPQDWFDQKPAAPGAESPENGSKPPKGSKLERAVGKASKPKEDDEARDLVSRLEPYADGFSKLFARACGDIGVDAAEFRTAPPDALRKLLAHLDDLSARA